MSASPDFIVTSTLDLAPRKWLCEVKCYTPKDGLETHEDLAERYKDCVLVPCVGGSLDVRKEHRFYYQILGQMNICGFDRCDLVVFYKGVVRSFTILNDPIYFWHKMYPKLKEFYERYFIPELVTKRIQRGLNP